MQRNAERTRSSSLLCYSSANLCAAASLRQPSPFSNSFLVADIVGNSSNGFRLRAPGDVLHDADQTRRA